MTNWILAAIGAVILYALNVPTLYVLAFCGVVYIIREFMNEARNHGPSQGDGVNNGVKTEQNHANGNNRID